MNIPRLILMVLFVVMPIAAGTILGWAAVLRIHRSKGELYGLPLALYAGLLFPLLLLDGLIVFLIWQIGSAIGSISPLEVLLLGLPISVAVDFWVVRKIWLSLTQSSREERNKVNGSKGPAAELLQAARLSRTAVIGACWLLLIFFLLPVVLQASRGVGVNLLVMSLGLLVMSLGPTFLGWIAILQIRHSAGRVYGLGLALFVALFAPLLALDIGIWLLVGNTWRSNPPEVSHPIGNFLVENEFLVPLFALTLCAVVDLIIIRWAWRVVRKPIGDHGMGAGSPTSSPPWESRLKVGLLIGAIIVAGIGLAIHFRGIMPGRDSMEHGIAGEKTENARVAAEEVARQPYVGEWEWREGSGSDDFCILILKDDGTATIMEDGEDGVAGTWALTDDGITMTVGDDTIASFLDPDGRLVLGKNQGARRFTRKGTGRASEQRVTDGRQHTVSEKIAVEEAACERVARDFIGALMRADVDGMKALLAPMSPLPQLIDLDQWVAEGPAEIRKAYLGEVSRLTTFTEWLNEDGWAVARTAAEPDNPGRGLHLVLQRTEAGWRVMYFDTAKWDVPLRNYLVKAQRYAGVQPWTGGGNAAGSDPEQVAREFMAAMRDGDIDAAMPLLAPEMKAHERIREVIGRLSKELREEAYAGHLDRLTQFTEWYPKDRKAGTRFVGVRVVGVPADDGTEREHGLYLILSPTPEGWKVAHLDDAYSDKPLSAYVDRIMGILPGEGPEFREQATERPVDSGGTEESQDVRPELVRPTVIHLPDADTAQGPKVLDLASGALLDAPDGGFQEIVDHFNQLGKGDLAWDNGLSTLRGARVNEWTGSVWNLLAPDHESKGVRVYRLKLPKQLLVTTAEGDKYLVEVRAGTDDGVIIRYHRNDGVKVIDGAEFQKQLEHQQKPPMERAVDTFLESCARKGISDNKQLFDELGMGEFIAQYGNGQRAMREHHDKLPEVMRFAIFKTTGDPSPAFVEYLRGVHRGGDPRHAKQAFLMLKMLGVEEHPADGASAEDLPQPDRDMLLAHARSMEKGDFAALEQAWEFESELDRRLARLLATAFAHAEKMTVELVSTQRLNENSLFACYLMRNGPELFGTTDAPHFTTFHRRKDGWRCAPPGSLRTLVAGRTMGSGQIGRRGIAEKLIYQRYGQSDGGEQLARLKAMRDAAIRLSRPPHKLIMYEGLAESLNTAIRTEEEARGESWRDSWHKLIKEQPEEVLPGPGDFFVSFYRECEAGDSQLSRNLPFAGEEGTFSAERFPCMTDSMLLEARVKAVPGSNDPQIEIQFTGSGARILESLTRQSIGKRLACVVDGKVISTPKVMAPINTGSMVITGGFSQEEAEAIMKKMNTFRDQAQDFLDSLEKEQAAVDASQ